jgi:hypothetical protein
VGAYGDNGKVAGGPPTGYSMTLTGAQYERACEGGLIYTTRLTVPAPGGYQIRAIVVDGLSDRVGSAMQFVELPEANQGRLAVSGLLLKGEASGKPLAEGLSVERETAAVRIFRPGVPIGFSYAVFNASLGPAKNSRVQVVTRIYATGREVYHGTPIDLEFPAGNGPLVREVSGKVQLDSRLSPGEYVIEVEVTDMLAKEGSPHVAFQYMTFEVRE